MIDALIKHVSVTYKCYEMYVEKGVGERERERERNGVTARVLKSIQKWTSSY